MAKQRQWQRQTTHSTSSRTARLGILLQPEKQTPSGCCRQMPTSAVFVGQPSIKSVRMVQKEACGLLPSICSHLNSPPDTPPHNMGNSHPQSRVDMLDASHHRREIQAFPVEAPEVDQPGNSATETATPGLVPPRRKLTLRKTLTAAPAALMAAAPRRTRTIA